MIGLLLGRNFIIIKSLISESYIWQIVQLSETSGEFRQTAIFDHPYPTTKIMWIPDKVLTHICPHIAGRRASFFPQMIYMFMNSRFTGGDTARHVGHNRRLFEALGSATWWQCQYAEAIK